MMTFLAIVGAVAIGLVALALISMTFGAKEDWHETEDYRWRSVSSGPTHVRQVKERRSFEVRSNREAWYPVYSTWVTDEPESRVILKESA